MGALLTFGIICGGILAGAAIYKAFPAILNFICALINWNSY